MSAPTSSAHFASHRVDPPTTRLAPSPTGPLHVGHARSFIAAWLVARARGGRVVLRIEDLDRGRCRQEWTDASYADLEWLGLDWDGPVLVQSHDEEPYRAAAAQLVASGHAYPCICSRRELREAIDAPHASTGEVRYPGTCRHRFATIADAERTSGLPAGVRFRVPEGACTADDLCLGTLHATPHDECGDFLLVRRDGAIAYQLAVVVDDARQGVDLVVRGDDLVPSTLRQALLQRALGLMHPTWLHLPLVHDSRGERLSKRGGALSLRDLAAAGIRPERIVSAAARSLGLQGPKSDAPLHAWLDAARRSPWTTATIAAGSSLPPDLVDRPTSTEPPRAP
jgi:glutamyl-tRNA synthetase